MRCSLLVAIAWIVLALPSLGHAGDPPTPSRIVCSEKSYPNLPGRSAVTLVRKGDGSYTATYENYGSPKTKKGLRCHFDLDPLVFSCANQEAGWGLSSTKLDERSIDLDGKAVDAHVYKVEAVKTPLGEARVEQELRFSLEACKAGD